MMMLFVFVWFVIYSYIGSLLILLIQRTLFCFQFVVTDQLLPFSLSFFNIRVYYNCVPILGR